MHKPTSGAASRGELALVAIGLAALTALVLFLTDGAVLFTRPFWVDEWFTVLVTSRANPLAMLPDLAAGADGGTGLFHAAVWIVRRLGGGADPILLRAMSLACVFSALLIAYAVLRQRVGREAAIVGVLATGSHPLVVAHSYEARFYGPWLLCAAFFAWTLGRSLEHPSARTQIQQGLGAALLCGVHFYGVISFSLMIAGVMLARIREWRSTLRLLRPSLAGLAVVAAIVPIALAQKRAYTVPSWVPAFEPSQVVALGKEFWFAAVPMLFMGAALLAWMIRRGTATAGSGFGVARTTLSNPGLAALVALAAMPLALAVVSLAGQPSMLSRYAITAVLAWAPLAAIVIEHLGRLPGRIARLALVWMWLVAYTAEVRSKLLFSSEVADARATLAKAPAGAPVLTPSIHMMYPLVADSMGGTSALRFLMLPDSLLIRIFPTGSPRESRGRGVFTERDLARIHAGRFGFPSALSLSATDSMPTFVLLGSQIRLRPGFADLAEFARAVFPDRTFTPLGPEMGLSQRR